MFYDRSLLMPCSLTFQFSNQNTGFSFANLEKKVSVIRHNGFDKPQWSVQDEFHAEEDRDSPEPNRIQDAQNFIGRTCKARALCPQDTTFALSQETRIWNRCRPWPFGRCVSPIEFLISAPFRCKCIPVWAVPSAWSDPLALGHQKGQCWPMLPGMVDHNSN